MPRKTRKTTVLAIKFMFLAISWQLNFLYIIYLYVYCHKLNGIEIYTPCGKLDVSGEMMKKWLRKQLLNE